MASERSERDTYRGNTIENRGCLFIYMYGRTYVILYFDLPYFCVRSAFNPVPNFTATNTRITLEIELFTALNCFAGAVKTKKLMGAPFLFELVAVVS